MKEKDPNLELENEFLRVAKELSAKTKNPRYAMKAAASIKDMKDIYKFSSNPEDAFVYFKAEVEYKNYADYS